MFGPKNLVHASGDLKFFGADGIIEYTISDGRSTVEAFGFVTV